MFKTNQVASMKDMEYATAGDFCTIFDKDMNSLYLLSLLLAGDRQKAEQCFATKDYNKAEVEYLNVLRLDRLNRNAIQRLGIIYFEEGSPLRAFSVGTLAFLIAALGQRSPS